MNRIVHVNRIVPVQHLWINIEICLLHLVLKSASVLLPSESFDFFESEFRKLSAS